MIPKHILSYVFSVIFNPVVIAIFIALMLIKIFNTYNHFREINYSKLLVQAHKTDDVSFVCGMDEREIHRILKNEVEKWSEYLAYMQNKRGVFVNDNDEPNESISDVRKRHRRLNSRLDIQIVAFMLLHIDEDIFLSKDISRLAFQFIEYTNLTKLVSIHANLDWQIRIFRLIMNNKIPKNYNSYFSLLHHTLMYENDFKDIAYGNDTQTKLHSILEALESRKGKLELNKRLGQDLVIHISTKAKRVKI